MNHDETKNKILDAAVKLFATKGIQATSIRQIIKEAGVNVASVHYHFGSKEIVIQELIKRTIKPIAKQKLDMLDDLEKNNELNLKSVIRAFVIPHVNISEEDRKLIPKLIMQLENEAESLNLKSGEELMEVTQRYLKVFEELLPELSFEELIWRFKLMVTSIYSLITSLPIPADSPFHNKNLNIEYGLENFISFVEAGFSAPPTKKKGNS